jgi:hypothetical protein
VAKPLKAPGATRTHEKTTVAQNYALYDQIAPGLLSATEAALLKRIGEAESGFAMKPNSNGASTAYGIFQILKMHDSQGDRYTAKGNILLAIKIFKAQGTQPWITSKHNKRHTGWGD